VRGRKRKVKALEEIRTEKVRMIKENLEMLIKKDDPLQGKCLKGTIREPEI
jgi:hypothetical protein